MISNNIKKFLNEPYHSLVKESFAKMEAKSGVFITTKNKEFYDEIINYIDTYLKKTPLHIQRLVKKYLDIEHIRVIATPNRSISNYCVLGFNEIKDEPILYIIVPYERLKKDEIDIDEVKSAFMLNIKNIVYSIYQEILRFMLFINMSKVRLDKEMFNIVTYLFTSAIVKLFGKKYMTTVEESKIRLAHLGIAYVFAVYYLKYKPNEALNFLEEIYGNKYQEVFKFFKEKANEIGISKYTDIKQLGTLLNELDTINMAGTVFIFKLSNEIGTRVLIEIFSSYPALITTFIIAKYPVDYLPKSLVVGDLNDKLEDYIVQKYV